MNEFESVVNFEFSGMEVTAQNTRLFLSSELVTDPEDVAERQVIISAEYDPDSITVVQAVSTDQETLGQPIFDWTAQWDHQDPDEDGAGSFEADSDLEGQDSFPPSIEAVTSAAPCQRLEFGSGYVLDLIDIAVSPESLDVNYRSGPMAREAIRKVTNGFKLSLNPNELTHDLVVDENNQRSLIWHASWGQGAGSTQVLRSVFHISNN